MKRYKFNAKICAAAGGAHVLFPFDTEKEFGTKGRVPVNVTFDGIPYTGSLIKYGPPQHMLPMLKAVRETLNKGDGDMVAVELWKDDSTRTVEVPDALNKAMEKSGVSDIFKALSYTHQKEYCRWITEAKREPTRLARIDKAVQLLKNGARTPN